MIVNVYYPLQDKHFSLDVGLDLTIDDFKALCSIECNIAPSAMKLFLNSQHLAENKKTLKSYSVAENDMFLLRTSLPAQQPHSPSTGIPRIDFSNVRVPVPGRAAAPQTSNQAPPQQQGLNSNMEDPAVIRQRLLNSPRDLSLLKERNPPLADALLSGDLARFSAELKKIKDVHAKAEMERIQMLNADPMDLEVQKKIAEEIQRKNIEDNMNMAIEEAPESFGQVVMLWINLKVNGHHVKAFVDSGAQMTIMSANCAKRCNIMRLVDKRWEGVAKGVGTQKIIGRVHLAQIQIEDIYLQCSFAVLEDQPMDVLLGLDMLRRHLCVIDLRENFLLIGSTKTETRFLSESELPSHGRLHDPNTPSTSNIARTDEEAINESLLQSAAEAKKRSDDTKDSAPASKVPKPQNSPRATPLVSSSSQSVTTTADEKLDQLVSMGFDRSIALEELRKVNGDLQRAIVSLVMKNMKMS